VHELEKEYGDRLTFVIRPYNEGDAQDLIASYEMDVHGMVITDQDGNKRWMESGHDQKRPAVQLAIEKLLAE